MQLFQALATCRLGQGMKRLAIVAQHGKTYPVVGMCSVVVEFPQWTVLRISWGIHSHRRARWHVVKNEPESSFLLGQGTGESHRS